MKRKNKDNQISDKSNGETSTAWKKLSLILLSAFLTYLVCTPRNMYLLQIFSITPFLFATESIRCRINFFWGWLAGTFMNLFIFYWLVPTIEDFSNIPWLGAIGALILFASWGGVMYGLISIATTWFKRFSPSLWPLLFASFATSVEYIFPQIFPWFQGCGQVHNISLLQVASWLGIYGISFLVFYANALMYQFIKAWRASSPKVYPKKSALIFVSVLIFLHLIGFIRVNHIKDLSEKSEKLNVAMIQDGRSELDVYGKREMYWNFVREKYNRYLQLTKEIVEEKKVDLVIWPEASLPYLPLEHLQNFVKQLDTVLILGAGSRDDKVRHTCAFVMSPDKSVCKYDKVLLLAFGEYNPLESYFPAIADMIYGIDSLSPGPGYKNFTFKKGNISFNYTILLCYEAIFSSIVRGQVKNGAELVINLTKDSWFGITDGPYQHMMLVSLKAVEMGIPILRSTNTGLTVFVDVAGNVYHESNPLFKEFVFCQKIPLFSTPTLYRQIGPLFPIMLLGLITLYFIWIIVRIRRGFYKPVVKTSG